MRGKKSSWYVGQDGAAGAVLLGVDPVPFCTAWVLPSVCASPPHEATSKAMSEKGPKTNARCSGRSCAGRVVERWNAKVFANRSDIVRCGNASARQQAEHRTEGCNHPVAALCEGIDADRARGFVLGRIQSEDRDQRRRVLRLAVVGRCRASDGEMDRIVAGNELLGAR